MVSKDEILSWKNDPVTRCFMEHTESARDHFEDAFAMVFAQNDAHKAALFLGRSRGLQDLLEWPAKFIREQFGEEVEESVDSTAPVRL